MGEPTYDEILAARNQSTKIIALYGQHYLPVFERLDMELSQREEQLKILYRALAIAGEIGTQNDKQNGTQNKKVGGGVLKIFNKNSCL